MSVNKETVQRYIDGFNESDHGQILSCLTDDIEWLMPGMFHLTGKASFDREIENDTFGGFLEAVFCDAFEMENGRIRRLITYQVMLNEHASGVR